MGNTSSGDKSSGKLQEISKASTLIIKFIAEFDGARKMPDEISKQIITLEKELSKLLDQLNLNVDDDYGNSVNVKNITKCELCNEHFTQYSMFKKHIRSTDHQETLKNLFDALEKKEIIKNGQLGCILCSKYFYIREHEEHMKTDHREKLQSPPKNDHFPSSQQITKILDSSPTYDQFMSAVQAEHIDGVIAYYCASCPLSTTQRTIWDDHCKRFHSFSQQYKCNYCRVLFNGLAKEVHEKDEIHQLLANVTLYGSASTEMLETKTETIKEKMRDSSNNQCRHIDKPGRGSLNLVDGEMDLNTFCITVDEELNKMLLTKCKKDEKKILCDLSKIYGSANVFCRFLLYGSRASGLAIDSSNCNLSVEQLSRKFAGRDDIQTFKEAMKNSSEFDSDPNSTSKSGRLAVFIHRSTGIKCLLYTNGLTYVKHTYLFISYIDMEWRIKWILVALKLWFKDNKLFYKGGLDMRCMLWLALFFLVQGECPFVPPVCELEQNNPEDPESMWVPKKERKSKVHHGDKFYLTVIRKFFDYYATFDFEENVLSPSTGKIFKKSTIQNVYFGRSSLCIEDPLSTSYNLTTNINLSVVNMFKYRCIRYSNYFKSHNF